MAHTCRKYEGQPAAYCALIKASTGFSNELYSEILHCDKRIKILEDKLALFSKHNEDCQRLLTIPGIGSLTATALVSAGRVFNSGRALAAWLGLVPRQHSTGGKSTLMAIIKRGDCYLRMLLIHGGRVVVRVTENYHDKRNKWIKELEQRRGKNITAVGFY